MSLLKVLDLLLKSVPFWDLAESLLHTERLLILKEISLDEARLRAKGALDKFFDSHGGVL